MCISDRDHPVMVNGPFGRFRRDVLSSALVALTLAGAPAYAQGGQRSPSLPGGPAEQQAQSPSAPTVDPVTGRPIGRDGNRDIVDQSVSDRYTGVPFRPDGKPEGSVPAYIVLPPTSSSANEGPILGRTPDRALVGRRLPGETIRQRRRPEYDPVGFEAGGVKILPYVMAGLAYDSNVFAEREGRGDGVSTATAGLDLRSDWGRHAVVITSQVRRREYFRYDSDNATTYQINALGRFDLNLSDWIGLNLLQQGIALDRSVADDVVTEAFPTRYRESRAELSAHLERGDIALDGGIRIGRQKYRDNETVTGVFVDQQFRNYDWIGFNGQVGIDIGGLRSLYGDIDFERRRFDIVSGTIDRDADVYRFMAGIRGGVTRLIRGHLALGYMLVDFRERRADPLKALAVDAELDWLFTERTTFNLKAKRDIRTVAQNNARGAVLTSIGVGVDHELLRNVILSASAQQQWNDYIADPRRARATVLALAGAWLVDRHFQIRPMISYALRTDQGFGIDASPEEAAAALDITYRF